MAAEPNVTKKANLAKVREADFVYRFTGNGLTKLIEALGVARKIPMQAGTTLKAYKATGTLQDGAVAEGDIIPLSQFETKPVDFGEINLNKWRKAVTAEAILKSGYDHAVNFTNDKMLNLVQAGVRKQFFDFLNALEGTPVEGGNLQETLAKIWGQLQVKFEDDAIEAVYFVNPLDIADYLAQAQITTQTAFGMTYVEDFLGLGTVIMNSNVTKGTVKATAKENLVLYYIPVNTALGQAFDFTTDETGYIGVHEFTTYERAQAEIVAYCGIALFVERTDGVVAGTISAGG